VGAPNDQMNNLNGTPKMTARAKVTLNQPIFTRWPVQYAVIDCVKRLGSFA
jgi:hypothetical protein